MALYCRFARRFGEPSGETGQNSENSEKAETKRYLISDGYQMHLDTTKKHFRLDRMIAVVDPTYDPADDGHNWPLKASEAFGAWSGGLGPVTCTCLELLLDLFFAQLLNSADTETLKAASPGVAGSNHQITYGLSRRKVFVRCVTVSR